MTSANGISKTETVTQMDVTSHKEVSHAAATSMSTMGVTPSVTGLKVTRKQKLASCHSKASRLSFEFIFSSFCILCLFI